MEKEKLVHYVPADMVDRLKKLLVRLWETRNPASTALNGILSDFELEVRSLNDAMQDVSSKERNNTIREKEKNWNLERERLQAEAERGLEELRAAHSDRLEKLKVSFACEKAESEEAFTRAQREIEELAAENRRMRDRLTSQDEELKRRLFEAKAEYERESGRRVQQTVEEITGRLLVSLNAAEKKNADASAEAARANKEIAKLRDTLAERTRQFEESIAQQAEEIEVKEHDLASLRATAKELEKQLAELREAHQIELKDKLRAKESELNKAAANKLELERDDWDAQNKRQESLLAKTAEDLKKAQKEAADLTAENRRLGECLAGKDGELERRLFEAKSEFERESGRRAQEAVEEVTGRLLVSLKAAEKKSDEAAAEAARALEESARLKDALKERSRQFEERCQWQADEAAAKDRHLASSHEKVKDLEKKIVELNNEHHAELMEKVLEKEAEFRLRLDEFERERRAYLKSIDDLKSRFEDERGVWGAERERINAKAHAGHAELEAEFKASLDARAAKLERDFTARYAAELAAKDQGLAAAQGKARELEKEILRLNEEHHGELTARLRGKESELLARLEEFEKERDAHHRAMAGLRAGFEEEKKAREAELELLKAKAGDKYAGLEAGLRAALEKQIAGLTAAHREELAERLSAKEAEFRSRLEEFEKERGVHLKTLAGLEARLEGEKKAREAEGERLKAKAEGRCAELEAGFKTALDSRGAELERDYAARRAALSAELRGKEAELNKEAAGRLELERANWEARSKRQEDLLAALSVDFKKAQKEIETLTAENRRVGDLLAESGKDDKLKIEAQFKEALAAEVKERMAGFEKKEKDWLLEKERYESELSLCAVSARSSAEEQTQKMKASLAKWKEALEEEYKVRLAEQLRAKDLQLLTENGKITQEFIEKFAAMEARYKCLKDALEPKAGKQEKEKKNPGA